jgi:ribosome-associated toxin RatA of RatAB toxin-antitoxin module
MGQVEIEARVPSRSATEMYPVLCDFERYREHTDAVKEVTVTGSENGSSQSDWEVVFRGGILKWSETDRFDEEARTIHFEQTGGDDLERFVGDWKVDDAEGGCVVHFSAEFDMGLDSLDSLVEPIAERTLRENVASILEGLTDGDAEVVADKVVHDGGDGRAGAGKDGS